MQPNMPAQVGPAPVSSRTSQPATNHPTFPSTRTLCCVARHVGRTILCSRTLQSQLQWCDTESCNTAPILLQGEVLTHLTHPDFDTTAEDYIICTPGLKLGATQDHYDGTTPLQEHYGTCSPCLPSPHAAPCGPLAFLVNAHILQYCGHSNILNESPTYSP